MPRMTNKIEKRGNSYRTQVYINGRSHSVSGRTQAEVRGKTAELRANAEKGELPAKGKLTLESYLQSWLDDFVKHSLSPRSHVEYERTIRLYVLPTLGRTSLQKLQPMHLQRLYSDLLDHGGQHGQGLAPKTVSDTHKVVHRALDRAVRQGLALRNVADLVDPPKVPHGQVKAWSPEEQTRLVQAAQGTRWETLIRLALASGMRIGEILGLTWANVGLDNGVVRVEQNLGRDGRLGAPKTDAGRRPISLGKGTIEMLRKHRYQQIEQRMAAGSNWEQSKEFRDLVFTTQNGGPLDYSNVMRAYYGLLEKAGLPKSGIHRLRHSNASNWLTQDIHPKKVQARLGHANSGITSDLYSHLMPGFDREDADKLDALLG